MAGNANLGFVSETSGLEQNLNKTSGLEGPGIRMYTYTCMHVPRDLHDSHDLSVLRRPRLDLFESQGSVILVAQRCHGHLQAALELRHWECPALQRLSPGFETGLAMAWTCHLLSALRLGLRFSEDGP